MFQSPRSGKFVSDTRACLFFRGGLSSFNPLDRGNLYQINVSNAAKVDSEQTRFQSPRSGKFVSDEAEKALKDAGIKTFQSPRSGKFVSDLTSIP